MKRFFALLISLTLAFTCCFNTLAVTEAIEPSTQTYTEYFEDGSYLETTITEEVSDFSTYATIAKDGTKTATYKASDGEVLWVAVVKGTFTYTGSSATCTSSSITYTIYNTNWKITSATASKSGNKAIGDVTAKYYFLGVPTKTVEKTITLTCSAAGVLS